MEVNGIRVGLIGLTTTETPFDTQPAHVKAYEFLPYRQAVQEAAPQAREAGAELLIIVGHICESEMRDLAPAAAELGIAIIGGGHCHELVAATVDGVTLVQSGSFWAGYTQIELYFDTAADRVTRIQAAYQRNPPGKGDSQIASLIAPWRARTSAALGQVIGYTQQAIGRRSEAMAALLTRSWLAAYPSAQIALASPRYISQPLPAGAITVESLVSVLPTDNTLIDATLTGEQLIGLIEAHQPLYGGIVEKDGAYFLTDGAPLDSQAAYHVLLPKALYEGGSYYDVKPLDPHAVDTGIDWRQAVIDWLIEHPTSPDSPLEGLIP
jgi:2',3'-cyclic-nucleotide 2'-phosphodiesterase (5'-nucleotidase family)